MRTVLASAILLGAEIVGSSNLHAATPVVEIDNGAFVKLVGNPSEGAVKFQFGWASSTQASEAAGSWVGLYDVTRSRYVWSFDTGEAEFPERLLKNALPTEELPNGDYKVVFFVRATYTEPVTNISEIELPFAIRDADI